MKKSRLIFFAVFGAFHLFLLIFTLYVDSKSGDFAFLTTMLGLLPLLKYGAMLGFALLVADIVWSWISSKDAESEKAVLTHELNTLKAKLFDYQEAAKGNAPIQSAKTKP